MFSEVQTTFIVEDQVLRDLWFPGKGDAQQRPSIFKIEVVAPTRRTGQFRYTVFVWADNRAYRLTRFAGSPAEAIYLIAQDLERWYQHELQPVRF